LTVSNPARMQSEFGTPIYMAPEKLKALKLIGKDYEVGVFDEFKADIWSLGCLIWHILVFTHPIEAYTFEDMIKLAKEGITIPELPNLMDFEEPCYNSYKEIVAGCLTVDPTKRFTAKQV